MPAGFCATSAIKEPNKNGRGSVGAARDKVLSMRAASGRRFSPMSFSTCWSWLVKTWAREVVLLMALFGVQKTI
jgi:hypothetical protein